MKKVLFVTLYPLETNTSVSQSNIGIVEGLVDNGYDVTVLTPKEQIFGNLQANTIKDKKYKIVRIDGGGLANMHIGSSTAGIKRKIISWTKKVYQKVFIFGKTTSFYKHAATVKLPDEYYDIILSTSDPKTSHIFVKKMLRKKGLRYGVWIQHWGDPLADDVSLKCLYPRCLLRKIESKIIKDADRIIYVSPFTLKYQKEHYPKSMKKMFFVPLPCRLSSDCVQKRNSSLRDGHLKICYAGDYNSKNRNIMPLYDACKEAGYCSLIIAGTSDLTLEETANIRILPRVSQREAIEIEKDSDVIISLGNLHGTQIPGKIYYSAAIKKPILMLLDGEYRDPLAEYLKLFNRYDMCYNDKKSIIAALNDIWKRKKKSYTVPECLTPINVAKRIVEDDEKE